MPATETPAPPANANLSPAIPNPVIVGAMQSPLERAYANASQPLQSAMPASGTDDSAARLEAARASDRGERAPLAPRDNTPNNRSEQDRAEFERKQGDTLQMRQKPNAAQRRRADDWETIKSERDNLRAERDALNARLNGGGGTGANSPNGTPNPVTGATPSATPFNIAEHEEFKKLKAERDTYYEEIKHVRVEADPEFRAKFDGKRDAAIRLAKGAARAGGDEVAKILAISDPDLRASRLAEQIKDYSEGTRQQIIAANAALTATDVERQIEIETRKATWEHTKAARDQSEAAKWQQRTAKLDNEFNSVLSEWSDPDPTKGMPFLIDDKVRERVVPAARQVFSGEANPRQLAQAALQSALFPEVVRMAQAAYAEIERINGSNDRYRSSYPGSEQGAYVDHGSQQPPPPINPTSVDGRFLTGLEAARARDMGNGRY